VARGKRDEIAAEQYRSHAMMVEIFVDDATGGSVTVPIHRGDSILTVAVVKNGGFVAVVITERFEELRWNR
jgi:hypothetical protein